MTRYEAGFLSRCMDRGLDPDRSMRLMRKSAFDATPISQKSLQGLANRLLLAPQPVIDGLKRHNFDRLRLNQACHRAAERAREMKLPENHPSWVSLRKSLSQLWDDDAMYVISNNVSLRALAAAMADMNRSAGATKIF